MAAEGTTTTGGMATRGATGAEGRVMALAGAIGRAAAAAVLGLPATNAPGMELTVGGGEFRRTRGQKEWALQVFAIAGLEDIKFERERGFSETGKVKVN